MLHGWWCMWLFEAMTGGGRCQEWKKSASPVDMIMGEGIEGREPCPNDISNISCSAPGNEEITEMPLDVFKIPNLPQAEMDLYTQASKALSYRSPFDDTSSGQPSSSSSAAANVVVIVPPASTSTSSTLPNGLAQLLTRHSDSRKRHKKSHSGSEHKSSSRSEKGRGANIWVETEEYFREVSLQDIERLHHDSNFGFSGYEKYFTIPNLSNIDGKKDYKSIENNAFSNVVNCVNSNGVGVKAEEVVKEENGKQCMDVDSVGEGKGGFKVVLEENVDVKGAETGVGEKSNQEEKGERGSCAFSGVEWLLGSRSKIYLTSERPSKKRKLLGGDAGLEKLLVACPVEGSALLCHYCSLGDSGDQLNRLIVCSSCGVAVHQRCYGVQEDVHDSWCCSWCKRKQKSEVQLNVERRCILCPKQNGALKPTRKRGSESEHEGSMEFAHLFCCQWMPEVYVENTRTMEPIVNLDGIKDTRRKLVCYLCKDKCGACVRCSNGACRTSFHPICAREARHRMEIWGKLGDDEVELRAFCSKHSEVQNTCTSKHSGNPGVAVGPDSSSAKNGPVVLTNKPPKLKIGLRNGDKRAVSTETADSESKLDKFNDGVIHQEGLSENRSKVKLQTECGDAGHLVDKEALTRHYNEDISASDSPNFTMILKMLVERGKVDMKDVAIDTGVSLDSLASMLTDNHVSSDVNCKIVKWLKNHAHLGSLQKPLKVKIKSSKAETDVADDRKGLSAVESDAPDVVPVKSVPPRRRTKSNIRILQEDKVLVSSKEATDDVVGLDESRTRLSDAEPNCSENVTSVDSEKILSDLVNIQDISVDNSLKSEAEPPKVSAHGCLENSQAEIVTLSKQNPLSKFDSRMFSCSVSITDVADLTKQEASCSSYVHPFIRKKLMEMDTGVLLKSTSYDCDGSRDTEGSQLPASSSSGICCNQHTHESASSNLGVQFTGANLDQLDKEHNIALLELSPADEVEGELIFYQHRLICNAVARKRLSDDLISKVVKSLPQEIDAARKQKWDAVSLNQYLYELREAKKQGRKERRHKEAQAVLAAATAAAAASSRISSLRKDTPEDSAYQEDLAKVNAPSAKPGQSARAKETLSRSSVSRLSFEKTSGLFQLTSDNSRENPRTCDICRRAETMLNAILVCSSCKVAVHLDCYRGVNNSTGPWYCELCEDLLSARGSGAPAMNSWERPYFVPECGLCGGTAGAFRKSTDGQWIHAFCAEWVLESTFRRGQSNPVNGLETIAKGNDSCIICRRKHGVCLKCHYGHCQSTFHPSCGRSAGFYMIVRSAGGKLQHKAYCEKHSLEQRAKAENQRHGVEELKSLKQVRVELERLRLLCERIIKREKLKRELVVCSQHILASKRDTAVLSARSRHPFFQPDISSESVTTSVKAYPDGCKSGSEVMQRSDDITVDSTVAGKRHIEFPMCMDNDQKTVDSSTSQHPSTQKPTERLSFAGKQIPLRPPSASSRSTSEEREKRSKLRMHTETFEKELVMTSDQASMKNQRLPKGYVYVPIRCLSKEKEAVPDACSGEPMQRDG